MGGFVGEDTGAHAGERRDVQRRMHMICAILYASRGETVEKNGVPMKISHGVMACARAARFILSQITRWQHSPSSQAHAKLPEFERSRVNHAVG